MAKHTISIPQTTKAALYIRVSTDMQADKDSLPLQESDLRKLADLNGIKDLYDCTCSRQTHLRH